MRSMKYSATSMATEARARPGCCCSPPSPRRVFDPVRAPKPFRLAIRPSSTAARRPSRLAMPRSWYRIIAFFGPTPGTAMMSRTPGGIFARRLSSVSIVPSRRNSWIFSAIDLPTLGIFRISAGSSVPMSAWYPPTARAAFSYERGLNLSSDRIASRSAYSRSTASTASFVRGTVSPRSGGAEEPEQQRLLRVQTVLGLIPHGRMRTVDHLGGDLLAAMRGKAVQHGNVRSSQRHLLGVELIRLEHQRSLARL